MLDTHVWLWLLTAPHRVPAESLEILADGANHLYLSAASAWEIAIKYQLGKLPLPSPPADFVPSRLDRDGILPLAVTVRHVLLTGELPLLHRDPFDRLLVAQARAEGMALFTADPKVAAYGGPVVQL
ncbi:MAG: type II toxin-antitoxin system VapC family toxin [Deferrisoma sp.]